MARKVLQHRNNTPARWWKWSRLGEILLRNARVAQKITNGCGPPSRRIEGNRGPPSERVMSQ